MIAKSIIIFIGLIYFLTLKSFVGNLNFTSERALTKVQNIPPFETSQERGRYIQTVSLAEYRTFNVDKFRGFVRPDLAWYNDHFYPAFPPGVSLMGVPAYLFGKLFGMSHLFTVASTSIMSIFTAILILVCSRRLGLTTMAASISALAFCLGSVVFAYSVTISAHPYSAFILTLMFYLYLRIRADQRQYRSLFLVFALYSLQVFIDYPNLLIALPILIASIVASLDISFIKKKLHIHVPKKVIQSLSGVLIGLIPFIIFNYSHFGKPIAFSNTYNLKRLQIQGIPFTMNTLSNDLFSQKNYSGRFSLKQLVSGIVILTVSSDRGIFTYSPIFIFALSGLYILLKRDKELGRIIVLSILFNLIVYGAFDDPWGGWAFGPRYMIMTIPFFAILTGIAYDHVSKYSIVKLGFIALLLFSIGINLLGALTTTAVPPSVEAVGTGLKDNYFYNLDYLTRGKASSLIYNTFLAHMFSPIDFGYILFLIIVFGIVSYIWYFQKWSLE